MRYNKRIYNANHIVTIGPSSYRTYFIICTKIPPTPQDAPLLLLDYYIKDQVHNKVSCERCKELAPLYEIQGSFKRMKDQPIHISLKPLITGQTSYFLCGLMGPKYTPINIYHPNFYSYDVYLRSDRDKNDFCQKCLEKIPLAEIALFDAH